MKRTAKEYFSLYRSKNMQSKRLKEYQISYIIRQCEKGCSKLQTSREMGISRQHVGRLWSRFHGANGDISHVMPKKAGRPPREMRDDLIRAIIRLHANKPMGAMRTTRRLREEGITASYYVVYRIMKMENMIGRSVAKSRKRKWIRYERRYSNAMWHVDWHDMKDPRLKGLKIIVYLDDASRCVTGFGLYGEATAHNGVAVLRMAIERFGRPATILSEYVFTSCLIFHTFGRRLGIKSPWDVNSYE